MTRITRILRRHLLVVAQFIAPFSESLILTDYTDYTLRPKKIRVIRDSDAPRHNRNLIGVRLYASLSIYFVVRFIFVILPLIDENLPVQSKSF